MIFKLTDVSDTNAYRGQTYPNILYLKSNFIILIIRGREVKNPLKSHPFRFDLRIRRATFSRRSNVKICVPATFG
jgi:hypothetical protein